MAKLTSKTFIRKLVDTSPEIREDVLDKDWTGLIHLQVGCLTRFAQKAIDANNIPTALKCFKFVNDVIDNVSDKIENALVISFVFHLSFTGNEMLHKQLPPKLKTLRTKLEEWENDLVNPKNQKLNNFLEDISKNTD